MRRGDAASRRPNLLGWFFVLVVAAVAEAGVRLFELQDSVAAPSDAVRALVRESRSGALSSELGATLESYVEGLAFATLAGVALGVVIGSSRKVHAATFVVIEFLRPIPGVALIPIAILLFGLGVPMRRFVIAYAALWPVLINTIYGVRGTDRIFDDVARTSGMRRLRRLVHVTLPGASPSIATGIRVSASIALLVGVTAEFLTGNSGVGAYMRQRQAAFELPEMYAAIVLAAIVGYSISLVLRAAERRVLFWVGEERAAGR